MPDQRCLWRPRNQSSNGNSSKIPALTRADEEREFYRIRHSSLDKLLESDGTSSPLIIVQPSQQSLVEIMNSSLVVGQEVALTSFLLAVHRVIVHEESVRSADKPREIARETLPVVDHLNRESSIAMALVYATLLVIVYYNQKAFNCESVTQTGQRRKKAMVRMTDAILLAAILRLTSGIIHTLTASYSSDTVYALSVCGMIIHLLTCDYRYANGACDPDGDETALHTSAHPRPAFLGGTVSLNDVFFSTSLLVSRIESDASSYAFVSLAVTLFAFYPATRHNIARKYPNTVWASPCFIIMFTISVSVWLIITSLEKILFLGILWAVLILSPSIQWDLQKHKRRISGTWDIAHIPAAGAKKSSNRVT